MIEARAILVPGTRARRSGLALALALGTVLVGAAACVPADDAGTMGSVEFVLQASEQTRLGIDYSDDLWEVRFDRIVVGFKTMTIGQIGVADACAYRGRGASSNALFDPRRGLVQAFNGINPTACPDVGVILGPPDAQTTLGEGASSADLVELASGDPAHAIVDATAVRRLPFEDELPAGEPHPSVRYHLRFTSAATPSRFGGCQQTLGSGNPPTRGVRIAAGERYYSAVRFAAERLFRDGVSDDARIRLEPLRFADRDDDGVVTMAELDATPFGWLGYDAPSGVKVKTMGDWLRLLFRSAFTFGDSGSCFGNPPDADTNGASTPSP